MLSLKYDVICISEGPKIDSKFFIHETISFKRKPSIYHDIKCFFQLLKIFINHKEISKIVISTPKISFISALACRIYQKPYIYLHRGAVYQNYKGLKLKIYKAIDKFIIKGSENTTFISKSLFAWVAKTLNLTNIINKRNFNSSKGVDLKKFFPIPKKLSSPKIVIGFCGRIVKDKGYNELIELIEKCKEDPNIILKIKGKIELQNKDLELFRNIIQKEQVHFYEWSNDVVSFYQSIDVLFFPSKREGFGNVLIEAASCGIPSIAYKIPGVVDAVVENESGILIGLDDNIVSALFKLINNKTLLKNLSDKSRQVASSYYDQELVLKDIHNSMGL